MKSTLVSLVLLFSITDFAHACPNLSGEYSFEKEWNGTVIIEQTDCSTVKLIYRRAVSPSPTYPDGIWVFSETKRIDGQKYEGMYDSLKLATESSYDIHTTEFVGNRLVMRHFEGQQTKCSGQYSFTSFDCKLFEDSFGYDEGLQSFTKIQVGQWRSDHDYENDVFLLKKTR